MIPESTEKATDRDLAEFDELPETSKELLHLTGRADEATGAERAAIIREAGESE